MNTKILLAALLFIISSITSAWCAPVTTYVAEFSVTGAAKPDELKSTIQTLLQSRLTSENITAVSKPEGAEIRVTGSYFVSGRVFSLDALAVNNAGAFIARAFAQGQSMDELIPAVGTLAIKLSEGIEKRKVSVAAAQTSAPQTLAPKTFVVPSDVVISAPTISAANRAIHKLVGALSGLAVGRTLSGGERELFMVGNHTLRYYRQGAELKLMSEIHYKVHEKVLAVDTADLDNNGIPEIYVTVMDGETLISQVWRVDGAGLKQTAGPLPYFFRAVHSSGGTKKLYVQKTSGRADFFGDVEELVKSGQSYTTKNPVKLPKLGYLYNFNILKGPKGELNTIIADRSGILRMYDPAGEELWKSSEEYSGSETFFRRRDPVSVSDIDRKVFLDQRIIVKANGELLVPKNSASWYMLSKHVYANNTLYCFAWNGSDLVEKWHTKQGDYYMADFAYDDSIRELLQLEVVAKEEGLFDKGASRLTIRRLE